MRKLETLPTLADPDAGLAETLALLRQRELQSRRRALRRLGGIALLASPGGACAAACAIIPTETAGPFPADGSRGPNVLTQSGIVRSDIRSSFGSAGNAVAAGTPLTVTLRLVNAECAPVAGYAVYMWHCDARGRYSLYSSGATTQNYLRGVQVSDSAGRVTFTTIFPAAYPGRWPHTHFEIFASTAAAIAGGNAVKTSQLALPEAACREVFAQSTLYPGSLANLKQTPLASDMVFADDRAVLEIAASTGSIAAGYTSTLDVGIDATVAQPGPTSIKTA